MEKNITTTYRVNERIKRKEILGYGMGDFASNLVYGLVSGFATYYYTNSVGMTAGAVGTMFMMSRIFDGITDIIMGFIIDRTHTKYGKARPWILWMSIPYAIAVILQFTVPVSFSPLGKIIYAYFTYNLLSSIVYTALNQSYGTLNVLITDNPQDRARLSISRMAMAMIASILLNSMAMPLITVFGGGQKAWSILAAIMGIVSIILFIITFSSTKERLALDTESDSSAIEDNKSINTEKLSFSRALKALFTNKFWVNRLLFGLALTIATMTTSANVYYVQYWLGNENLTGILSLAMTIPMLVGLGFVNYFLKHIGNRNTILLGTIIMLFGFVLQIIAPASLVAISIGYGIRGFGTGLASPVTSVMLGDTIDYGEWKSGVRTDGLIYSASSFGTKVGNGFATASLGWALALGGFNAQAAVQSSSALFSIQFVFTYLPLIATVICVLLNLLYTLDQKMPRILSDLEKRKN